MKLSIITKLDQLTNRLVEINSLLIQENSTADIKKYRELTREYAELGPLVELYQAYLKSENDITAAEEIQSDPDMREFAHSEIIASKIRMKQLENNIERMLLPQDPNDKCNIFLEIRAGTGGNESALFARDLLRMYTRFSERNHWKVEIVSESPSEIGGYKEVVIRIIGFDAYARLKFESGGHRVQRVPVTESQGRIHTSACTVAVMPEADEVSDVEINPADIRIDTYRASGAGGQHINKTDSAVRITHTPSGIVVECQNDRSQHKNKAFALKMLAARIKDEQLRLQQSEEAATRKLLVGLGDRSGRIRTYNFPQGRITDHRIDLTLYKLDFIMDGDLEELTNALSAENQVNLLTELGI